MKAGSTSSAYPLWKYTTRSSTTYLSHPLTPTTTTTMNSLCFIIITFFCIAGSTSAFEAFKDDGSVRVEAQAYCKSPDGYENSDGGRKYGPIEGWNVSAVTSMESLFYYLSNCNPPISKWDVSEVTTFWSMFNGAAAFNQDLSEWNVANGRDFKNMFEGAVAFNQDLSEWNVANGRDFSGMFRGAAAFNQDLSKWNVANGENFKNMFRGVRAFNQDLSEWNVANGGDFKTMFRGAAVFNQDLSKWNVANGQSFRNMFKNSGMNYFIGEWDFKSMRNNARRIRIFFSMLGVTKYDDASNAKWKQLNNLIFKK